MLTVSAQRHTPSVSKDGACALLATTSLCFNTRVLLVCACRCSRQIGVCVCACVRACVRACVCVCV